MSKIFAVIVAALAALLVATPAHASDALGPLTTRGASIYQGNRPIEPTGVSVSGLEHDGPAALQHGSYPSWRAFVAADAAQITAAATAWHANMIRLQVSERMIDGGYPAFRAQLAAEVKQALSLGLDVVINDNTQWDVNGTGDIVTNYTYTFWRIISRLYGSNPNVIFDLLNEPHNQDATGADWHKTFQPLVNLIRKVSANQIWAEGPDGAGTLAPIKGHLLTGGNIVYAFHHPSHEFTSTAAALASWKADFGWLATTHPVVNGEWSDWAAVRGECWTNPAYVPIYLKYLASLHIGMLAWALGYDGGANDSGYPVGYTGPGVLTAYQGSYDTPTSIDPATWACTNGLGQSAGALIQQWFGQH